MRADIARNLDHWPLAVSKVSTVDFVAGSVNSSCEQNSVHGSFVNVRLGSN